MFSEGTQRGNFVDGKRTQRVCKEAPNQWRAGAW